MQAILGFFGGILELVGVVIATAAGITFFIVLWKSGALPATIGLVGDLIGLAVSAVAGFFGFLRDLLGFARS